MKGRGGVIALLAAFLLAGGLLVWWNSTRTPGSGDGSADGGVIRPEPARDGGGAPAAPGTTISLLYSTEKEDWLREAIDRFKVAQPRIQVDLVGMGSLDAVRALLAGEQRPTLWSPADTMAVNLFATQWQLAKGGDPLLREGSRWPQSTLLTPLVFVIWESRARVLLGQQTALTWQRLREAVASRDGWRGLGGEAAWAYVKFGHTDPMRSNSGMQALVLMAYGFYARDHGLTVPDVTAQPFQDFIHAIEAGRQRQDFGAASTGTFMRNMIRQGPSLYDVAVVYEATAIAELPRAQGRWENLVVHYPDINIWSDHPICLFKTEWVTPAQRTAANTLLDFLMSPDIQKLALKHGFRPGNLDVPVRTQEPDNPFNRYHDLGIHTEVARVAAPPEGAVIQALLQTYQRNAN